MTTWYKCGIHFTSWNNTVLAFSCTWNLKQLSCSENTIMIHFIQVPTLGSEHFTTSPINSYRFLGVSLNPPASLRSRCLANIQSSNEIQKDVVLKMQYFFALSCQGSFSGSNSLPHWGLIQLHTQVLPEREKGQRCHYPISTWDSSCGEINLVRSRWEALSKIWKDRGKYKRKNLLRGS